MALGLHQGWVFSPLLFKEFFAAIILAALEIFSQNADILAEFAYYMQEQPSKVGPETALECMRCAILMMLYANHACIVWRSPHGLEWMMVPFVKVFGTF